MYKLIGVVSDTQPLEVLPSRICKLEVMVLMVPIIVIVGTVVVVVVVVIIIIVADVGVLLLLRTRFAALR